MKYDKSKYAFVIILIVDGLNFSVRAQKLSNWTTKPNYMRLTRSTSKTKIQED